LRLLLRIVLLMLFVGAAIFSIRSVNFSKPVDSKKTGKSCMYCHTKYGSKELTDAGKYYKEKGTLDGYKDSK
jgi:hypothetical protein